MRSLDYGTDRSESLAIFSGYVCYIAAVLMFFSNFQDLRFGKFGKSASFSMCPSAFGFGIRHIFPTSPNEEMRRTDAQWRVAMMQDVQAVFDWPVDLLPHPSVRTQFLIGNTELAIAAVVLISDPNPAWSTFRTVSWNRAVLADVFHELGHQYVRSGPPRIPADFTAKYVSADFHCAGKSSEVFSAMNTDTVDSAIMTWHRELLIPGDAGQVATTTLPHYCRENQPKAKGHP